MSTDLTSWILNLPNESTDQVFFNEGSYLRKEEKGIGETRNNWGSNYICSFPHGLGLQQKSLRYHKFAKEINYSLSKVAEAKGKSNSVDNKNREEDSSSERKRTFFTNIIFKRKRKENQDIGINHINLSPLQYERISINPTAPYTLIHSGKDATRGYIWNGDWVDFTTEGSIPITANMVNNQGFCIPSKTYKEFFKDLSKERKRPKTSKKRGNKKPHFSTRMLESFVSILKKNALEWFKRITTEEQYLPEFCHSGSCESPSILDNVGRLIKHLEDLDKTEASVEASEELIPESNFVEFECSSTSADSDLQNPNSVLEIICESIKDVTVTDEEVKPSHVELKESNYSWNTFNNESLDETTSIDSLEVGDNLFDKVGDDSERVIEKKENWILHHVNNEDTDVEDWKKPRSFPPEFLSSSAIKKVNQVSLHFGLESIPESNFEDSDEKGDEKEEEISSLGLDRSNGRYFSKGLKNRESSKTHVVY